MLQFDLRLENTQNEELQNNVIGWFSSICESITSNSLVVEVCGLPEESQICNKIENVLLALSERIETLSVYLPQGTNLFSRLCRVRVVVESTAGYSSDEEVRHFTLRSRSFLLTVIISFVVSIIQVLFGGVTCRKLRRSVL